jgi:curved DNA-binding protein CbpA
MRDLDHYHKVLGLEPGASLEEINQAYKDLAFIWHPDRVPKDNHRLQQKAQEKLKEINQARVPESSAAT